MEAKTFVSQCKRKSKSIVLCIVNSLLKYIYKDVLILNKMDE